MRIKLPGTVKSAVSDLCCRRPSTVSDRFSVHRRFHIQTDLSRATICFARPATAIFMHGGCIQICCKRPRPRFSKDLGAKLYLPVRCQLQSVKMRCLASAIDWRLACTKACVLRLCCSSQVQAVSIYCRVAYAYYGYGRR